MLLSELSTDQLIIRARAAQLGRLRLLTFCHLNTPHPYALEDVTRSKFSWCRHHGHIAHAIERLVSGEVKRLEIETPPRAGKSEVAVRNLVPWLMGKFPDRSWIVVTATDALAQEHGRDVRDYMRGTGYRLCFGHDARTELRSDAQSLTLLQVRGGGRCLFSGRGGLPAGVGGDGIIFDDFFKSAAEANSPTERDSAWRCFVADCQSRLNSDKAWILEIGSRKHEDDVQGRQFDPMNVHYDANEAAKWVRIRLPALAEANDPLDRTIDEPLWPERFSFEHYASKRNHASPVVRIDFQTQDQCKPIPEEGNYFKAEHLLEWRPGGKVDLPDRRFLRFYAASDHALRKKQANDSTFLLITAIDPAGRIFIMPESVWDKLSPDVMVEKMIDLMAAFHTEMWWAARDQISGSIEPFLRKRMKERGVFRPWDDSLSEIVDLVQRARSFQARTFMNMVYWPSHWQKWNEAKTQLLGFPNTAKDDVVAGCAMLGMGLDRMVTPGGAKPSNLPVKNSFAWHSWGQDKKETSNTAGWA